MNFLVEECDKLKSAMSEKDDYIVRLEGRILLLHQATTKVCSREIPLHLLQSELLHSHFYFSF